MLLLTLRGTPTLYYGDELGMTNVDIPPDQEQDPARFDGADGGRDPERTPMRWDATQGAGFTTGTPWLSIGPDIASVNVEAQRADPSSILTLYRRLIQLRRSEPALNVGDWSSITADGDVLAFERSVPGRRLLVALNLAGEPASLALQPGQRLEMLLSTRNGRDGERAAGSVTLWPNEGVILGQIQ